MGEASRWYQLYWPTDRELAASFVDRAGRAGYARAASRGLRGRSSCCPVRVGRAGSRAAREDGAGQRGQGERKGQWPAAHVTYSAGHRAACNYGLADEFPGIRRIMFAVEDIEDVLARLHAHGAELVGEVAQYEDSYRLCYVRGPEGIIVALAEQLS